MIGLIKKFLTWLFEEKIQTLESPTINSIKKYAKRGAEKFKTKLGLCKNAWCLNKRRHCSCFCQHCSDKHKQNGENES